MANRNPRRTDEEWLNLIQECRSSGLSDKCWCEEHHIHTSNFYYQIRRLRKMACDIPEPEGSSSVPKQEIVQLSFDGHLPCPVQEDLTCMASLAETVIRLSIHGVQVEITNAAASETVFHTLSALQRLC
jgi:hypothetical protein